MHKLFNYVFFANKQDFTPKIAYFANKQTFASKRIFGNNQQFASKRILAFTLLTIAFVVLFASCSLKYNNHQSSSSTTPEFVFNSPQFVRVANGKKNLSIDAEKIEQYETENTIYAKNLSFVLFNENQDVTTTGTCNLLSANTSSEVYTLFDEIKVVSNEKNATINAQNLKWNNKTEQLVSAGENPIEITKFDGTRITGYEFSASGIDNSFTFKNKVSGELIYEEN